MTTNGDGQPALNLIAGTAGASQFTGNPPRSPSPPPAPAIPCSTTSPSPTPPKTSIRRPVTGAAAPTVLARYASNDNPAILATDITRRRARQQRHRRGPQQAPGIVATLVTDAQVASRLPRRLRRVHLHPAGRLVQRDADAAAPHRCARSRTAPYCSTATSPTPSATTRRSKTSRLQRPLGRRGGGGYIGELEGATAG